MRYPIRLYWFEDGIHVVSTVSKYESILDCKLVSINGKSIESIVEEMTKIIPHDNTQWIKHSVPEQIILPQFLHGLNIINDLYKAEFVFENKDGEKFNVNIKSKKLPEDYTWDWIRDENSKKLPLYYQYKRPNYTYSYLKDYDSIYLQYNSAYEIPTNPMDEFIDKVFDDVIKYSVDKIIIDLRNNTGGQTDLFYPFIDKFSSYRKISGKNIKFYALVGQDTFSAGVINTTQLKDILDCTILGTATGGKPIAFGYRADTSYSLKLKNKNMYLYYSTFYRGASFYNSSYNKESLYPDITVNVYSDDYINDRDPVLEKALQMP